MIGYTKNYYKTKEIGIKLLPIVSYANEYYQEERTSGFANKFVFWEVAVQCHTGAKHCHRVLYF